ncbi:hypothetical protein [Methylobacterium sp. J-076]|uniref:hypothetical protein n=1 Tax=Methylobacterium sp. J-076 TaxID=2836655 RepID=UPI00244476A3|nr:hypothetical protein [Methylobacterium sp. J-076]
MSERAMSESASECAPIGRYPRSGGWPGHRAFRAAILTAGLLLAGAGGAGAQGFDRTFFDDDVLPPRVIAWRLADRGFTNLSRPHFDGRFYLVDAVNPAGLPVRLVLDPMNGAIVGRGRMPGQEVYARLERPPTRPMPGYGWTEDDVARPVPIPAEPGPGMRLPRRPGPDAARPGEGNPLGLNPDGSHRTEPPRRVARTSPTRTPDRPPARVSPAAPAPKVTPEAARPEPAPPTPAANANPAPDRAPAVKEAPAPAAEPKPVAVAAPKQEWRDPPAEGKRPVRVIGGATIVPGIPEKDGEAPQPQP